MSHTLPDKEEWVHVAASLIKDCGLRWKIGYKAKFSVFVERLLEILEPGAETVNGIVV